MNNNKILVFYKNYNFCYKIINIVLKEVFNNILKRKNTLVDYYEITKQYKLYCSYLSNMYTNENLNWFVDLVKEDNEPKLLEIDNYSRNSLNITNIKLSKKDNTIEKVENDKKLNDSYDKYINFKKIKLKYPLLKKKDKKIEIFKKKENIKKEIKLTKRFVIKKDVINKVYFKISKLERKNKILKNLININFNKFNKSVNCRKIKTKVINMNKTQASQNKEKIYKIFNKEYFLKNKITIKRTSIYNQIIK